MQFYNDKARIELRETDVRKDQSLEQFREWLKKHPFIKNYQPGKKKITKSTKYSVKFTNFLKSTKLI